MRIAQQGYRVKYEPNAYAIEGHSANIKEELKRKIRISAGGLQVVWRFRALFNIFKYGILSFQYISHRVLRWTLCPLGLPIIFIANWYLRDTHILYSVFFYLQILFYMASILGWILDIFKIKISILYIPYYFCMMNYSIYAGFGRLMKGTQSVLWEKSVRAK
jgi:poly-beta-1,6-N-acetyl-D-glucosamine synthase